MPRTAARRQRKLWLCAPMRAQAQCTCFFTKVVLATTETSATTNAMNYPLDSAERLKAERFTVYREAGSFTQYLIEEHGLKQFKEVFRGFTFDSFTGNPSTKFRANGRTQNSNVWGAKVPHRFGKALRR